MSDKTKIEWTDATWNPITGCTVVSPGCTHCYAMKLAGGRLRNHPSRAGLTKETNGGPVWTGEVRWNESQFLAPLKWRRPRRIFVCAHGDLFHPHVPEDWINQVWQMMEDTPQHSYQVLTKRSGEMSWYVRRRSKVLPNVWLGVSVEDDEWASERIPDLLRTPAAKRFISAEPLLGPINLRLVPHDNGKVDALTGESEQHLEEPPFPALDWVIVGGESGPGARVMNPQWVREIQHDCEETCTPFFFKQWGAWHPSGSLSVTLTREARLAGRHSNEIMVREKSEALLDGVAYQEMPT